MFKTFRYRLPMDAKETRTQHVGVMVTPSELEKLDAWRTSRRPVLSKSEAVRQLMLLALEVDEQQPSKEQA